MKILGFFGHVHDYEHISQETQTVPDQSLTVREILTRYVRDGVPVPTVPSHPDDDIDSAGMDDFDDLTDAARAVGVGNGIIEAVQRSGSASPDAGSEPSAELSSVDNPSD